MKHRHQNIGLLTFLEHWGLLLTAILAVVSAQVLMFFVNLRDEPWIYFFATSMALQISGAALIIYAKVPVYRSGQVFTFGVKSVPEGLAGFYRCGWRVFLIGVMLSLCLLLSRS